MIGFQSFKIGALSDYDAELKRIEVIDEKGSPCGPLAFSPLIKIRQPQKRCWLIKVIFETSRRFIAQNLNDFIQNHFEFSRANMLTKFESKSNRVKGLAFHSKRPWLLASLHSGVIQLWDYRVGTTIDRFEEHEGPVRGIHFHRSQPLFVSGGDDYKIKVWNYKLRRCLFTLHGHLDYIRTVQFHDEYPWIVSASDDQTIRIWNWQSRSCVAVLTGHNHYVMCAQFHMKEYFVVSASLDQTVRVWDISGLKNKSYTPGSSSTSHGEDILKLQNLGGDLFGGGDAAVKYVLEGHERGVNWASFHPTQPVIVSGADDRLVKLWRYSDSKAWETASLPNHVNNVSCVVFHSKQDLIISNSEDKTIRVWDMSRRSNVKTVQRQHDRFWVLAVHPEQNLIAAGHDSGLIVFKLERERLPSVVYRDTLFYVKDQFIRSFDYRTQKDNSLTSIRRRGTPGVSSASRSLSYNPAEHAVLLTNDSDGGSFELYMLPKESGRGDVSEPRTGLGTDAVFIARNRFAVLDKAHNHIQIRNLDNEITKKVQSPYGTTVSIFYAGTGSLLIHSEDRVALFDVQQRTILGEMNVPVTKYAIWNDDLSKVALLSKHSVTIADKKFENSCTIHEAMRVKSAAFDANDVLIYTTLNHLKYCLPNGDNGIIKTLDECVYLTKVFGNAVFCLDREGKSKRIDIDNSEYLFKLALTQGQYDRVMQMIREQELCGQAIIAYLQEKGFPEVALHFVKDQRLRFNLAVECGNIEVAMESAQELDQKDTWYRLGLEALKQGNHQIVEYSYQKTKNFGRLSFLYLITGNVERLSKMLKIYEMYDDPMGRFQSALYVGNVRDRIKVLEESGQQPLAYVTARNYGLTEESERIVEELDEIPEMEEEDGLLYPPIPIMKESNWPLLTISKGFFDGPLPKTAPRNQAREEQLAEAMETLEAGDAWGEEDAFVEDEKENDNGDSDGGWDMEDLELPAVPAVSGEPLSSVVFVAPTAGTSAPVKWSQQATLAAELCCAGEFDGAMRLLNRQLGIHNFDPLKPLMLQLFRGVQLAVPGICSLPSMIAYIENKWDPDASARPSAAPATIFTLNAMEEEVKKGYDFVTAGKFTDAVTSFTKILHQVPLLIVETRKEVDDVKELVGIAKEYLIALRCEIKRKECKDDLKRSAELAAYFTHCKLEKVHEALGLRSAMNIFFKLKNFATCAQFCRRLIELNPPQRVAQQARSALLQCEKSPEDSIKINYDSRNPFDVCSLTFAPIYRGTKFVECPYTGARFFPECEGKLCPLGELTQIGVDASGLVCSRTQMRG